jgi:hypothetical protein
MNRKPRVLWIIMHHGYQGWLPSVDHFCAWQTKKAALNKVRSLGEKGKIYNVFKYVLGGRYDH